MIIFPTENPANRFVHAPKALFEDNTITWKAKGMIAWMASHSEHYKLHVSVVIKNSKEGRDSVYSGLKEICTSTYGRKVRFQNNQGHIKYHYAISVTPHTDEEWNSFISQIDWESMGVKRTSVKIGDSPMYGKPVYGSTTYGEPTSKIYKENKSTKKEPRLLTSDNEIFPTFTDIPFDKMSIAVTQLKTTFGKRFDDDWYKLVFEMFCCSNDEKRNPVPSQHDLQLQFRKYATNTGKHDQQRDARANNTKDKSLERIEAHKKTQADKWHSSYDKVPEIALMELTMANLSHIANDVWNSYVTNQINYNQNFKEASQLKYDFEDFIKRNEFRLKKQAQQLQVTQDSNDLSWVDELNDEIARGERLDSFTDVRSEKQIN